MKLMIIVGSIRPGRAGLPVAQWVHQRAASHPSIDVDFVDLKELAMPFMDEPNHPAKHEYTKPHTIAWSERVDAADAFILVSPEYNHSYSPVLKNALDYLSREWHHKPVSIVSYGGVSAGTRGAAALEPVLTTIGLVKTGANVEINFIAQHITDGVFHPEEKHDSLLHTSLNQLRDLAEALRPLR
ncbi:NAD(P)H-dependent FMN reductase [Microbacteriaceae bacterium SG_E_30_P1]|uniref:NAD(P)H-dependent FMN reductase n=1 Tax=Antiquaquibacter oligotrophicus TaxID=2880260 RepID=A0ABT6KM72_9MICO|nr:NAD(P)H-dependent oxidoreductase [Antiquaquibacter oligotrophicus]MDH6180227.1 NAD(P)H-dependent FMN reductase [Antiquaquibacter oligotrophicus]UDF14026.1 NAD(P)H-dependent oxidoreductase [Antiquaquibacter oligotrophicus]